MKKIVGALALLGVIGLAIFFFITQSSPLTASALPQHTPDVENGKRLYNAGGCISCHKPSKDDKDADASLPSSGFAMHTPAGTLYPPNITPDKETGIGNWSDLDFVNAMKRGISPSGQHYIMAFPYTSYAKMPITDILDLKAYMNTLKPVKSESKPHEIPVMWFARRGFGLWKLMAFSDETFKPDPSKSESWNRGAYLVAGPGHCGECHTPRNLLMMPKSGKYLAGGPHPEGGGNVPSLINMVGRDRVKNAGDVVFGFQMGEGLTSLKLASGGMESVQTNLARLDETDLNAIAEYLVSLK